MAYKLTEKGRAKTAHYIAELTAKRKEILDAGLDKKGSPIPSIKEIEEDMQDSIDDYGDGPEYLAFWAATKNYDTDGPLSLMQGTDFTETKD